MRKIIKSMFYAGDDFQPAYMWVTIIMVMIVIAIIMRLRNTEGISDTLILGMCGFVSAWLTIYNWNSIKNPKYTDKRAKEALDKIKDMSRRAD